MPVPNPTVSVVLAVHDGAAILERTLDSTFAQTYRDYEVVAVDDGSTDETSAILARYAEAHPLRVVRLDENVGLTRALIAGVQAARGAYVARIDAGDEMAPDRLRAQAAVLNAHPEVGLVTCDADVEVRVGGVVVDAHHRPCPASHDAFVAMLPFRTPVTHVAVMFRTAVYHAVGGYDAGLSTTQDYDLWIRMARASRVHALSEALVKVIYDSESSITFGKNKKQIRNGMRIKLRAIRRGHLPLWPTVLSLPKHAVMIVLPFRANQALRGLYRRARTATH